MSGYLENLFNGDDENINPLTAGIGFNDGANKGFWRIQPRIPKRREGAGQWIEMGAELRSALKVSGKVVGVIGRALGSAGSSDTVRMLIQGMADKGIPDGIYSLRTKHVDLIGGTLSDEYLRSQGIDPEAGGQSLNSIEASPDLPNIEDVETAPITSDDIRLVNDGINSPEGRQLSAYKESSEGKAVAQLDDVTEADLAEGAQAVQDVLTPDAANNNGGLGAWRTETDEGTNGEILSSEVIYPPQGGRIAANDRGFQAGSQGELFAYSRTNAGLEANKKAAIDAYNNGLKGIKDPENFKWDEGSDELADQLVRDAMDGKPIPGIVEISESVADKKGKGKKKKKTEPDEEDLAEDVSVDPLDDLLEPEKDTSDFDLPVIEKGFVPEDSVEVDDFVNSPDTDDLLKITNVEPEENGDNVFTGIDRDGVEQSFTTRPGQELKRTIHGEPGDTDITEQPAAPAKKTAAKKAPVSEDFVPKNVTVPKNAKPATHADVEVGDATWTKDGVEIGTIGKILEKSIDNFGREYTRAEVVDSNGKVATARFVEGQKYSKVPKSNKPVAPEKPADPTKPADIPEPVVTPTPQPEPAAAPAGPPGPPKGPETAPAGDGPDGPDDGVTPKTPKAPRTPKAPKTKETPAIPDSPEKPEATPEQIGTLMDLEDAGIDDPDLAAEVAKVLDHKGPVSDLDGEALDNLIARVEASRAAAETPEAPKTGKRKSKIIKRKERPEDAGLPPVDRVDDGESDIDWPDDQLSPEEQAERVESLRTDKVLPEFDQFGRPLFLSDSGNAFVLDQNGNPIPITDEEAFRGLIYEFYPNAKTTADGMRTILRRFKDSNGDTVELSVSRANMGRSVVELRLTSSDGKVEKFYHYDDRASFAGLHGKTNSPQMIMDILTGKKTRKFGRFDSSKETTVRGRFKYFRLQTRKTDKEGRGSISTFATPAETWAAKAEGHAKVINKSAPNLRLQQRELLSFWDALDEGVASGNFDDAYFRARKFTGAIPLNLESLAEFRGWLKSEIKNRYPQMPNRQAANLTNTVSKQMRSGVIETGNRRERPFMSADGNTTIETGQWVVYTNPDGVKSYGKVRRRNNSAISNPAQAENDFQYRDNVDVEFANGFVAVNLASKFLRVLDDPARRKRLKEGPKKYGPDVPALGTLTTFVPGLRGQEMYSQRKAELLSYEDADPEAVYQANLGSDGVAGDEAGNAEGGPVSELADGDTFYGKDGSPLGIVISMQPIVGKSGKPGFAILYVDEDGVDHTVKVAADEVRSPKA